MARIRYLKPDFFKDEDLAEHPHWIRLLFAGLWNIADKEGRLEDRVKRIKVDVFPYDNIDIERGLQELSKPKNGSNRPFIQRYDINGDKYIQIVNWHKHQRPHHTEQESRIPPPPPLMEKGMEKGMENQLEGSTELRNGGTTGKKPLSDEKTIHIATLTLKTSFLETKKKIYPMLDIEGEIRKCVDWHTTKKGGCKNWERAITNWLKIAYEHLGVIGQHSDIPETFQKFQKKE